MLTSIFPTTQLYDNDQINREERHEGMLSQRICKSIKFTMLNEVGSGYFNIPLLKATKSFQIIFRKAWQVFFLRSPYSSEQTTAPISSALVKQNLISGFLANHVDFMKKKSYLNTTGVSYAMQFKITIFIEVQLSFQLPCYCYKIFSKRNKRMNKSNKTNLYMQWSSLKSVLQQ